MHSDTIDNFNIYRFIYGNLKYANKCLDSFYCPANVFLELFYDSSHVQTLFDGSNSKAEIWYTSNKLFVFVNTAYYPVVICGIK